MNRSPAPSAKRQAPSAKRQAPSAKRQAPSAKRQAPSAKRQAPSCALAWLTWGLLVALVSGCGPKPASEMNAGNAPPVVASATDPDNLTYDVGRVIAGETVTHDFSITNTGNSPIVVQTDDDIRPGCGCSSLVPETRELKSGSRTRVTATVHTQGFGGSFDKGGSIVWTAASGQKRVVQMAVRGVAIPPLYAEPDAVRFDPEGIQKGVLKELWFREGTPLDWSTFSLTSSSPYVSASISRREKQAVSYAVHCTIPDGLETFSATITAKVRIADASSPLKGTEVSLVVPVAARQKVDLMISPKSVPVTLRGPEHCGTARLLLRGSLLESEKPVLKSVRCDGFQVDWKLNHGAADKAAILEVMLKPQGQTVQPHPEIAIEVEGKGTFRFPVVVMQARPT